MRSHFLPRTNRVPAPAPAAATAAAAATVELVDAPNASYPRGQPKHEPRKYIRLDEGWKLCGARAVTAIRR